MFLYASIGIGNKRKKRKYVGPLWKIMGDRFSQDMDKADVLNDLSILVFTRNCSSHTIQATEGESRN